MLLRNVKLTSMFSKYKTSSRRDVIEKSMPSKCSSILSWVKENRSIVVSLSLFTNEIVMSYFLFGASVENVKFVKRTYATLPLESNRSVSILS